MVVVGAGTGGTITGIARKFKERCPDCIVVGVDPHGSILAEPENLNGAVTSYKVEGIGYDFIPNVLERSLIDRWIKSDDKNSFEIARRLIREEGLLCGSSSLLLFPVGNIPFSSHFLVFFSFVCFVLVCVVLCCFSVFSCLLTGGSSGTAMWAALQVAKELGPGKRCVVILPDSVRNYMSKFLSMDWMKANDFVGEPEKKREEAAASQWAGATIADLHLTAAVTISHSATYKDAVELMKKNGFDNLPVVNEKGAGVGLVSMTSVLSKLSKGLVKPTDDLGHGKGTFQFGQAKKKKYVEISSTTPLASLSKFFEINSVAFVTDAEGKILHVVTKVDLVSFLLKKSL